MVKTDLVGKRYGRLLVTQEAPSRCVGRKPERYWDCRCDCGKTVTVRHNNLTRGLTRSCGCYYRETRVSNKTHGWSKHPLYHTWQMIHERCENTGHISFARYGGRGVQVCERWSDVANFIADMSPTYRKGLTLDRKDTNGPYSPENCRWATWVEQERNRNNNHRITFNGQTRCIAEWAEITGIHKRALWSRLKRSWSIQNALTRPTWPLLVSLENQLRLKCGGGREEYGKR